MDREHLVVLLLLAPAFYISKFESPIHAEPPQPCDRCGWPEPDYITLEIMPNLHALGERGAFGSAAFPSVNSVSTGSYPARHGLMQNTMFVRGFSKEEIGTFQLSQNAAFMVSRTKEKLRYNPDTYLSRCTDSRIGHCSYELCCWKNTQPSVGERFERLL
jgi:hypothetical protein